MKKKNTTIIGMTVCFLMMTSFAWAIDIPGVPNGTVTDGNLVWLQNANCFGQQSWYNAKDSAANLKSGSCGLTDGSKAGQWRLPTKAELINRKGNLSGFVNVQSSYWSSTEGGIIASPVIDFTRPLAFVLWIKKDHRYNDYDSKINHRSVWPVRSVQ